MAFIDEITVFMKAGKGGDGVVRWRREKFIEFGGPSGGDGGRGGSVYVIGSRDISLLGKYIHKKSFIAEDGEPGGSKSLHGAGGEDLIVPFPIGSVITNTLTGKTVEILSENDNILLLQGGKGGVGNEHFKSSTNQAPQEFTRGTEGHEGNFHIELKLVVDVGFAGLPNAGKSSLLNAMTNATAKIGAYQFTTLEPNLGAFFGYILADIPGLIEGASEGKGLGHKFLKHITRTKMLAHLISLENEDVMKTYKTVRKELETYSDELAKKDEIIVLTKTDMVNEAVVEDAKKAMAKLKKPVFVISVIDDAQMKAFQDSLVKLLRAKDVPAEEVSK
jgi:GTP-binding protein